MRIYRVEHNRDVCKAYDYKIGGRSPSGHGPATWCYSQDSPSFGCIGPYPRKRMREYERCAVTAEQFPLWLTHAATSVPRPFNLGTEWSLIAYEVEQINKGLTWFEDNMQIIFNPVFATNLGKVNEVDIKNLLARKPVLV
jgi:hypothetical protein